MNPKDMTNAQLVELVSRKQWTSIGCHYTYEGQRGLVLEEDELLRRLDEADALRKENEELRNLFGECPKRNNRLGTYSDAKPVQIDVCKLICIAKESEARHE